MANIYAKIMVLDKPVYVSLVDTGTTTSARDGTAPIYAFSTSDLAAPAASAALADATANPTTVSEGAYLQGFNGTTWDRIRTGLVAVQTTFVGLLNAISMARYNATPPALADGNVAPLQSDANGYLRNREQYAPAYEDNVNGKAVVEQRNSYARVTADGQIKASAGFLHTVSVAPTTALPTAGLVTIYDNTAESGTAVYSEWIFATDVGHTIILDVVMGTGIYVGYDAALANVSVTVSYR